jgi:hypothetical protein
LTSISSSSSSSSSVVGDSLSTRVALMVLLGLLALGVGAYVGSMSEQRLRDTSGLTSYAAYTVAPVYNCPEESAWLSHPGTPLPLVHYVAPRVLVMRKRRS